jgi:hypothetical protein
MHFDENVIRWTLGLCLDIVVAIFAVRSGLLKRLPVFTCYLLIVVVCDLASTLSRLFLEPRSAAVFYEYWAGQAIMIGMRAAAVAEICFRLLGPYRGIWRLWRLFLAGVALFLVASAAYSAAGQQHSMTVFITVLQRGLELAIAGTLAFAFVFAKYYELKVERFMMLIVGGLLFYSAVQIGNSQFMSSLRGPYYGLYAGLSLVAFNIASLIWLAAVWKPVPAVAATVAPAAMDVEALGASRLEVNARLRELNARLSEILR